MKPDELRTVNSYFAVMARLSSAHFAARFGQYNIGAGEHRIIDYVFRNPGCNQDEVAYNFRMNKGATSRMVRSLAAKGFITAQVRQADKRERLLFPTEKGEEIFPFLDSSKWLWEEEILQGVQLPREELVEALEKIESNMKILLEKER